MCKIGSFLLSVRLGFASLFDSIFTSLSLSLSRFISTCIYFAVQSQKVTSSFPFSRLFKFCIRWNFTTFFYWDLLSSTRNWVINWLFSKELVNLPLNFEIFTGGEFVCLTVRHCFLRVYIFSLKLSCLTLSNSQKKMKT